MVTDNHYRWDFIGLSTDDKPTPSTSSKVTDGSTFYCSDNSKLYVWYSDQWYERKALGGGGGGGTSDFDELENRPKYNGSEMTSLTDIPQLQFTTMPTASSTYAGKIVQYVGETNQNYVRGYFYECRDLMPGMGVYVWYGVLTQAQPANEVVLCTYGDNTTYSTITASLDMMVYRYVWICYYQGIMYQFVRRTANSLIFSGCDSSNIYTIEVTSSAWGSPVSTPIITTSNNPIHNDYYFSLPSKISVRENTPINIYPDNVFTQNYLLKWGRFTDNTTIRNYDNYISVTPTTKSTKNINYSVYDRFLNVMDTGTTALYIKDTPPTSQTMMLIGDSFITQIDATHNTGIAPNLRALFTADSNTLTLIGSKGTAPNLHEGYAGWKYTDFVSGDKAPTSPFWDGTKFDFRYYMEEHSSFSDPDSVYIQLGTNDASAATVDADFTDTISAANTIVDSILDYKDTIKVYLGLTVMPNLDSTVFASSYNGVGWNWVMRANMQKLNKLLIENFADNSSVTVVANNLILDSTTDISDNVHPTAAGYQKMANQLYYTMMSQS